MKRVSGWYLFVLNAYWIGLSFMWNSLHVTILPAVLLKYIPEAQKNTWLGLLTFFGLILAMTIQPLSGALSDHWQAKMGRRRPFMWLGTGGDLIFLLIMGFIGGLPALFIGYLGLQTTSNLAHGPAQGLLPDEVPAGQLGMASGIKTTMDMAGIILSSLLMGFLISSKDPDPTLSIIAIIAMLVIFGGITLIFSHEKPTNTQQRAAINWKALWKSVFYFKAEGDKNYWRLIFSRFLYLVGIYGFQTFAQYFIRDRFPKQDPIQFTQFVMGSFVIVLIIFSLLSGKWSDKIGRKRLQIISSFIGSIGAALMIFAATPAQLLIFGSVLGAGMGIFLATNWALANQMAPQGDTGKFIGLTNLATAGSAAIARLEGPMIDWLNGLGPAAAARLSGNATEMLNYPVPSIWWGWTILFAISAVLMLASAWALQKVPDFRSQSETPTGATS